MDEPRETEQRPTFSLRRLLPLILLLVALVLFFAFGLHKYLTLDALAQYSEDLAVVRSLWWAPLAFAVGYAVGVVCFPPGGSAMTIAGGFMFGQFLGTLYIVVAATVGATLLFLVAKTSLGDALRAKAGPALKRMEAGFQENELSYLLVLRLIPLFPFCWSTWRRPFWA